MRDRELILRSAFWSGRLTYRKWRGIVRRAPHTHTSILVQAFVHMPIDWLLKEMGRERFTRVWPELRKHLLHGPPPYRVALDAWDGVWGMLAVGDISYPVKREVAYLPKKRRELLRLIISNPGITTYELARLAGRNYSRVLKDVKVLVEMGEVSVRPVPGSPRRAKVLIPINSVNTELAGLKL